MDIRAASSFEGHDLIVSRSGYTGEDGYEILVPADGAPTALWDRLLADERVQADRPGRPRLACAWRPACRSTATTWTRPSSPIEAGLTFAVNKRRREQRDFPGAARIVQRAGRAA